MSRYLWIGFAGCLGAVCRYWLGGYIASRLGTVFPLGTFAVNVSGSFLLGFLATVGLDSGLISPVHRTALTVGFLGAYTTFSTWTWETLQLIEAGSFLLAGAYVAGSLATGLIGVALGAALGRLLF